MVFIFIIRLEDISDVLTIFLKTDSISENFFNEDPQMTSRNYVLVNYTPSQKKKIKAILHTHSYNFSEPFANHRKGLFIKETRDRHDIARLIGCDYKLLICPLTEVHVMYLNPGSDEVDEWLYYE